MNCAEKSSWLTHVVVMFTNVCVSMYDAKADLILRDTDPRKGGREHTVLSRAASHRPTGAPCSTWSPKKPGVLPLKQAIISSIYLRRKHSNCIVNV